jgi:flavorubredoxin
MKRALKIAEGIYWVGAIDWNIRDFHGYSTYEGSTYNAFLILDEKVALIDTVKRPFLDELLERISSIIDPKKIDLVISNHTEMDHSGALPALLHIIGKKKPVYCSKMGKKNLSLHFQEELNLIEVKDKEEISIGKRRIRFLETRMIHWPDSMFSYLENEHILFSSDAFGQHYASTERFDDQVDKATIMLQAKKYYANIILPYSSLVKALLEKITKLNIQINMICPDHGILWRTEEGISQILDAYNQWSEQKRKKKALVVYDTMWHSTEMMAETIAESIAEEDIEVKVMNLRRWHRSDIMTEMIDAAAVLIGSPTINNGLFPTVSDFLTYMKGLKPKNKIVAAFGSYGWSGEAVKLINKEFEEMKLEVADPGLRIQFVPDKEGLRKCREFGKKIASILLDSV